MLTNETGGTGKHEYPLPNEISQNQKGKNELAHEDAEKDMNDDVEFSSSSPNEDLDEGESARLGEDLSKVI